MDEFNGEDELEVDLLKLMFTSLKLGEVELESGQYNAIRLVLDEGSQDRHGERDVEEVSRVVYEDEDGETQIKPLVIPSEEQSGIKIDLRHNYLDLTPGSEDMSNINILNDRGVEVIYEPQK